MRNIGLEMRNRRIELGVTLQEVADYVGATKGTVSKWEKGNIESIKIDKVQKLSDILRVSPLFFITDDYKIDDTNKKVYYFDDDTAHYAREIEKNSLLKSIVDITTKSSTQDALLMYEMLKRIHSSNGR